MRGLLEVDKLHILQQELVKQTNDIGEISKTHWKDRGHYESSNYKLFMSEAERTGYNGVAILVVKKLEKYIHSDLPINDRLIR